MNQLSNDVNNNSYPFGYYRYYWGLTYYCQTQVCATKGALGYYRYRVLGTIGGASSNNQAMFLQDNWRVNRRLTLNIGLRTEHEYVPSFSTNANIPSQATCSTGRRRCRPASASHSILRAAASSGSAAASAPSTTSSSAACRAAASA